MNSSTTSSASGTPAHAATADGPGSAHTAGMGDAGGHTAAATAAPATSPAQHDAIAAWFAGLQARIVAGLEGVDGGTFLHDAWQREPDSPTQGRGISCVIDDSHVLERGGVMFSDVEVAQMPPTATAHRKELAGRKARATGVSLVLHPRNPYVPTVHMNVRFFRAMAPTPDEQDVWWFGGGMDLTPYYGEVEDARHFHQTCFDALQPFGPEHYPAMKAWCDEYFFLKHRNEARGIGGIFFDDLNTPDFATAFALTRSVGDHFLDAYLPIVRRRMNTPYGERERTFQALRRGRYVEFNLVIDRGTLFGLHSGGRTESILASMPPTAGWRYQYAPEAGTPEARLYTDFLPARDWLGTAPT